MLGPFDYVLWMAGPVFEAAVLVCLLLRREFFTYISINIYLIGTLFATGGQFAFVRIYGLSSMQYRYYYYYSESLVTILLFFVILQFYQQIFAEIRASAYIRRVAVVLLAATVIFSYHVVHSNKDHLTSRFVVELGENLYFVGLVLTYLLWGAILKLRETRTRLIQLVLALGVFFSATAATYALRNLFPGLQENFLRWIPPLAGLWLPAAWAFTFIKVPEEARLATAHLLARAR
ncbi:MAG: hypothetical protein WA002_06955 [Candidatus Acidiferrales bacterium]